MMSDENGKSLSKAILVVGGGISGITTAVEAAEVGYEVYLVEKSPSLGGRVAQMHLYFPKLCPPACGLEINYQRLKKNREKIKTFTLAEVVRISGQAGAFEVDIKVAPRYVNEKCTVCGECSKVCPADCPNDFNYGMDERKAVDLPHEMAYPFRYALDISACKGKECSKCVEACAYDAIDLEMTEKTLTLSVGAIVTATGWEPYDAKAIDNLGFGRFPNVITNVMMERLAAPGGPTGGKILRPSDGQPVRKAVFVQCAGSRDVNHLAYCSGVCCLASLKHATYLREKNPESEAHMFYIDLRTTGIYEDFLNIVQEDEKVHVTKGKVAKVEEIPETKNLVIEAEDILGGGKMRMEADLVVLATGMVPSAKANPLPLELNLDEYGFCSPNGHPAGVIAAGTAKGPTGVASSIQDATGAALKAIHITRQK